MISKNDFTPPTSPSGRAVGLVWTCGPTRHCSVTVFYVRIKK